MKNRARQTLIMLMSPINPSLSALLGALTLFWGVWVVSPFWDAFSSAKLYSEMQQLAPEWAWGTWSAVAGIFLIRSALRRNYKTLVRSLAFIGWHWAIVSVYMWMGDWTNTGPVTYSMLCVYSVFCYLNIKLNYVGIDTTSRINRMILRFFNIR